MAREMEPEPLVQHVAMSYMHDLQVSSHTFVGLSSDDLEVLVKHFSVQKVTQNTNLWTQGADATSFVLLLRGQGVHFHDEEGSAKKNKNRQVVGHLNKGDYAGADEWLQSKQSVPCKRKSTLRLTDTINVLLVCPFEAVEALCRMDPGGAAVRFLRLVAMGAASHTLIPASAPPLDLRGQPVSDVRAVQQALSHSALFQDMSLEQTDSVLRAAEMVSFVAGDHLFHAGQQAGAVYCLVRGELDVRQPRGGGHVCTISAPGEVLGESVLPFVTHKRNVTTSKHGEMLRITPESLQQLHVKEPVVGYKLMRNLVRDTLSKMDQLFGVQSLIHHPVWLTRSREEGLLAEESLAVVAEALRVAALEAQDQLDEASASKMGTFERHEWRHRVTSDMSVPQLLELLAAQRNEAAQRARDQHLRHEEHLASMVPKKDLEAVLQDLDGWKKREMEARRRLNHTLETMDKLEADLHAERVKYVKENESLKAELAKTESWLGEVEADFHKQTESAKKREADLTDRVVKSRKELLSYQQGPQLQARDKVLNNLFIDEVKQLQSLVQTQSKQIGEAQQKSDYLQFKVQLLTQELEAKTEELSAQEMYDESMDNEFESSIPELQASLASSNYQKAQARWAVMTHRLVAKRSTKNQFTDMIKALKAKKAKKDELCVSRAEAESLQSLCAHLRSQLHTVTAQAETDLARGHERAGVARSAICMLGHLVGCLVKRLLKLESQNGQRPEPWEQPHLDLLKKGWSFLADRHLLKKEFEDIDIKSAVASRTNSGHPNFHNMSYAELPSPHGGTHHSPPSGVHSLANPPLQRRGSGGCEPLVDLRRVGAEGTIRRRGSYDDLLLKRSSTHSTGGAVDAMPPMVQRAHTQKSLKRPQHTSPSLEPLPAADPSRAREWCEKSATGQLLEVCVASTAGYSRRPTTTAVNIRPKADNSPKGTTSLKDFLELEASKGTPGSRLVPGNTKSISAKQLSPTRVPASKPRQASPMRRETVAISAGLGRSIAIPSPGNGGGGYSSECSPSSPVCTVGVARDRSISTAQTYVRRSNQRKDGWHISSPV